MDGVDCQTDFLIRRDETTAATLVDDTIDSTLGEMTYEGGLELGGMVSENRFLSCKFTNAWKSTVVQHRVGESVKLDGRILNVSRHTIQLGTCELP